MNIISVQYCLSAEQPLISNVSGKTSSSSTLFCLQITSKNTCTSTQYLTTALCIIMMYATILTVDIFEVPTVGGLRVCSADLQKATNE